MQKLPNPAQAIGAGVETNNIEPSPNSLPATSRPVSQSARNATELLFKWCRMPDVGDPRVYLAGVAAILDEYPQAVRDALADPRTGTRLLKPYPWMHDVRAACDKAYEPIERDIERKRAADSYRELLTYRRAPRTPEEQTRIDAQVAGWNRIKASFDCPKESPTDPPKESAA